MSTTLRTALAELGESTITPLALRALDTIVPGEWEDLTDLDAIVREVTGQDDPALVRRIASGAEELYADDDEPYRKALRIYSAVDTLDRVAAGAVVASKLGERVKLLGFLNRAAPKPDTVQAIDAAVKLAAELTAFGMLHGLPTASIDGVKTFAGTLKEYSRAEGMRLAGWIIIDGVIPLGPDFVQVVSEKISGADLGDSKLFAGVREWLPGDGEEEKRGYVMNALSGVSTHVADFIAEHGITTESAAARFARFVDFADASSELLAAGLDTATNYFRHTGTQTVARYAVQEAWEDLQEVLVAEEAAAKIQAEVARQQVLAHQAVAQQRAAQHVAEQADSQQAQQHATQMAAARLAQQQAATQEDGPQSGPGRGGPRRRGPQGPAGWAPPAKAGWAPPRRRGPRRRQGPGGPPRVAGPDAGPRRGGGKRKGPGKGKGKGRGGRGGKR